MRPKIHLFNQRCPIQSLLQSVLEVKLKEAKGNSKLNHLPQFYEYDLPDNCSIQFLNDEAIDQEH